jgi:hypothetical protein
MFQLAENITRFLLGVKGVKNKFHPLQPQFILHNFDQFHFNDSDDAERYAKTVGVRYIQSNLKKTLSTADLFSSLQQTNGFVETTVK